MGTTPIPQPEQTGQPQRDRKLPVLAWVRLMRVYQKMNRRTAEEMRPRKLSVSRFDILNHVGVREGRTQQELANALFVTKGNIVQLLDGMEADGLLYRRRRGRTNLIYLTDAGRALREESLACHESRIADDLSALTPEEQTTLLTLLRKLDKSLDQTNA
jgi:DNA-binding MarR family transcriptional regulator